MTPLKHLKMKIPGDYPLGIGVAIEINQLLGAKAPFFSSLIYEHIKTITYRRQKPTIRTNLRSHII